MRKLWKIWVHINKPNMRTKTRPSRHFRLTVLHPHKSGTLTMTGLTARLLSDKHELEISSSGFQFVNWKRYDQSFEFWFGDDEDRIVEVHPFIAEFISPAVSRQRQADETCYSFSFPEPLTTPEAEAQFRSLVRAVRTGQAFYVDYKNIAIVSRILEALGNSAVLSSLFAQFTDDNMTPADAVPLLSLPQFERFIPEVAAHFYQFKPETLEMFDVESAARVLSDEGLKVVDEDSIYYFIVSHAEKDRRFDALLEYIHYEYLTKECMEAFLKRYTPATLNGAVWERIASRLVNVPQQPVGNNKGRYVGKK